MKRLAERVVGALLILSLFAMLIFVSITSSEDFVGRFNYYDEAYKYLPVASNAGMHFASITMLGSAALVVVVALFIVGIVLVVGDEPSKSSDDSRNSVASKENL